MLENTTIKLFYSHNTSIRRDVCRSPSRPSC